VTHIVDRAHVVSIEDMTDENFAAHMAKRHLAELNGLTEISTAPGVIDPYRAYHERVHSLRPGDMNHEHD
jgi:hypothetical protein